ncbi:MULTISPECIES: cyclic nucleotide-binding domain-containing protein [Legionella]|uniref:Cyclic nucleotide-binding domain-containing protein n=1 Tax=Legionella resiliens TaxID=2905958 RepID=A0ABS8WZI3_9GAMM|nr:MULTISPECIES: cyclic nucleotide-binding domain-containing protein [unclassified Legionella]MCE0721792.1 cyclic nucleotide-binding domain-containing protein [Legionella sp. 9fVS26]MCE3530946.1 cyclic nucleotide-binding domain-containing protein [Legionella sp. 8cVS16]QLZ70508.1 cyclic nucleotide-binding domain-containing protein [Legionella sp. PC1000]
MDNMVIESDESELNLNKQLTRSIGDFLNPLELELLVKYAKTSSFTEGETIVHQGERADSVYLILEGTVLVTARVMSESVTNMETLQPGIFFTASSFIEDEPCSTSFIASSTVLCLVIPRSYFELLSADFPETRYKLLQVIAQQICNRLKTVHDIITSFISDSDMTSLSFFERMIYSLNQPKKIIFEASTIDKSEIENLLLYKSFTQDEIDTLLKQFVILNAPKNCKLVNEGDNTASCYLVIYGAIQSCIIQDGKLAKLSVIGPGRLIASIGCVEHDVLFNFTYVTCEHTILCKLSESTIQLIQKNNPRLWYKLFNLIFESLVALKKSIYKLDIRLHIENYNR